MKTNFGEIASKQEICRALAQECSVCEFVTTGLDSSRINRLWAIKDNRIVLYTLDYCSQRGWSSYERGESDDLSAVDCPLLFLTMTEPIHPGWRERVLAHHASGVTQKEPDLPEDEDAFTEFLVVVENGDDGAVAAMLDLSPAFVNRPSSRFDGETALYRATLHNYLCLMHLLLDKGAEVDSGLARYHTPLGLACWEGRLDAVQLLMSYNADPEKDRFVKRSGKGPLLYTLEQATLKGRVADVKRLLTELNVNVEGDQGTRALYLAVYHGHLDIARMLLERRAERYFDWKTEETLLHIASGKKCREMVSLLVAWSLDVNAPNWLGVTPLHVAAQAGDVDIVSDLLCAGADPMVIDRRSNTPLDRAHKNRTKNGRKVAELLESRMPQIPFAEGKDYATLLAELPVIERPWRPEPSFEEQILARFHDMETEFGDYKTVYSLYEAIARKSDACEFGDRVIWAIQDDTILGYVIFEDVELGWGALETYEMVYPPYVDCPLQFLQMASLEMPEWRDQVIAHHERRRKLANNALANLEEEDPTYGRFLVEVEFGTVRTVMEMLQKHPEFATRSSTRSYHRTPLHRAATFGRLMVMRLLRDHGADVHALNGYGQTAIERAAPFGGVSSLNVLLDYGARLDGEIGLKALDLAAQHEDNFHVVQFLLSQGVNVQGQRGKDALNSAMSCEQYHVMRLLLEHGAGPDVNFFGRVPILHEAILTDQRAYLKLLLDYGANPNILSKKKQSPLHLAVKMGKLAIVADLLEAGADICLKDKKGDTALELARKNKTPAGKKVLALMEAKLRQAATDAA